jgi:hypothetical protein
MSDLALSEDAAVVLALAGTAIPFSDSAESEAEHWLRILRMHGEVGSAMQALGVGERPLEGDRKPGPGPQRFRRGGENVVDLVTARAVKIARTRAANLVGTIDVFEAVRDIYGGFFDDVLYSHGAGADELLERLASAPEERRSAAHHTSE